MASLTELLLGQAYGWLLILTITVLSTILLTGIYYRLDRYDPEPLRYLFVGFLVGILVPVVSVPILLGSVELTSYIYGSDALFIEVVVLAPVIEELCKGFALYQLLKKMSIDSPLDAFLYGIMVGAGFAFIENIAYGIRSLFFEGISQAITLTILRGGFAIIGHPIYTGIIGFGLGAYRVGIRKIQYRNMQKSILLHMTWNFTFIIPLIFPVIWLFWVVLLLFVIFATFLTIYDILKIALKIEDQLYDKGYFSSKRTYKVRLRSH